MKDALDQAAKNLFGSINLERINKGIFIEILSQSSGKRDHISDHINTAFYLSIQRQFLGSGFNKTNVKAADIIIEGFYSQRAENLRVELKATFKSPKGNQHSNTSAVFNYDFKGVGILKLDASFLNKGLTIQYTNLIHTVLKKSGVFQIQSSKSSRLTHLRDFQKQSGCYSHQCIVQLGKRFNADQLLATYINKQSNRNFLLTAKLLNAKSGKTVLSHSVTHRGTLQTIGISLDKMATQFADKQKIVSLVKELKDRNFSEVVIKSKPDKAEIFLDGKPLWKRTNTILNNIQPGQHTFRVVYNNSSAQKTVFLPPGETTELEFILTPFKVQSTTPSQTEGYISLDSEFVIRFNTDIDPSTITSKTFSLVLNGKQVRGTIEKSNREIRFKPSVALKLQQRYLLKVSNYIKDSSGNYLAEDFYHMYRTQPYPNQKDDEILIFSNSHAGETYTLRKKGKLQIGITTFTPITHIDVNGIKLKTVGETLFVYEIPYQLNQKNKRKDYVISVLTKVGMARKRFTLHYGRKPKPKAPAFSTVGILKYTTLDNVNSSVSGTETESASKYTLTLVPQHRFDLSSNESITIKGILLRDQFTDDAYQDSEVSYTQIALEWKNTKTAMGETKLELGYNDIKLNNQESPNGSNALTIEQFVNLGFMKKVDKTFSYGFSFEYKQQDSKLDITDEGDNADATVITLQNDIKTKFLGATNAIRFKYGTVDAVGKYKDTTNIYGSFKQLFKFGNFKPSWSYTHTQTDYTTKDDRTSTVDGNNLYKKAATTSVKLGYQLAKTITIALEYKNKKQESNVQSYNYENNSQIISYTQMF